MKLSLNRSVIVIAILFSGFSVFGQAPEKITGKWKGQVKDKQPIEMEIYLATDSAYYGKIINDNNSPSKNGMLTLKKLKYNKSAQTFTGTMHPPDANITADATVSFIDNDTLKLVVKKLFMTRTVLMSRIK